jgi:hypothetical protein
LQTCFGTIVIVAWKPSVNDAVLILVRAKPGGASSGDFRPTAHVRAAGRDDSRMEPDGIFRMNSRSTLLKGRETEHRPSATVIALSRPETRRFRRDPSDAEPMGRILFFTGVRYERMPDVKAEPTVRQRKRS